MGDIVEFPSNGKTCSGYLAVPRDAGPGIVVIQEWWGLVDHIKDVCERFASGGFVALAPDLYHGRAATEPDEAGKLLMSMQMEEAARDMSGAVDHLRNHPAVEPKKIGATGFCAGGGLALLLAASQAIDAVAPFYPALVHGEPDYSGIRGAVMIHAAEHDEWAPPDKMEKVAAELGALGRDVVLHVYPGTSHAFFNDTRPEIHDASAAKTAWERTIEFFNKNLR